jgi:hypothetical protein
MWPIMRSILLIYLVMFTAAFGADTNLTLTVDGVTYNDVRFGLITPVSVSIIHSTGVVSIPLTKLPPELQRQFGYNPQKAAEWQAAQQKAAARAAEARKVAAEASRKAAATTEWALTVERILPDGIMAHGYKTGASGD